MGGVVAAGDPQTAAAAAETLAHGGNAVDAAIAAAFAAFSAESVLVTICGGGVSVVSDESGRTDVYNFFAAMPSGTLREDSDFREIWVDFAADRRPFYIGRASVAVPGIVAGLEAMSNDWGSVPLASLIEPGIRLAHDGAVLSNSSAYILDILKPIFTDTPKMAEIFFPGDRTPRGGDVLKFPEFADTLAKLQVEGPSLFYTGRVAEAILRDQQENGGLIMPQDLESYRVHRSAPIQVVYRGYDLRMPDTLGGTLVAFALHILSDFDFAGVEPFSAEHLRRLAETMRAANIARADLESGMSAEDFLSEGHLRRYREMVWRALEKGDVPAEPAFRPGSAHTTHITVVDDAGLTASMTITAGENAGFMVEDTGVMMNNILGEVDINPNGFHRMPSGERLYSMMTPTVVTEGGRLVLAVGTGGSTRIRSAVLQVLTFVLDFGMSLRDAVNAPRIHFEEGTLHLEGGLPKELGKEMAGMGYRVNLWPGRDMYFGGVHSVSRENGLLVAVGDPRRGGSSLVV